MKLYNTLSHDVQEFAPADGKTVKMYVCGVTVYDHCHIGHARAMISFDVVYRWLIERGHKVTYVRNYTDVDDKIIARAQESGEGALELSQRFIKHLDDDMERLGLAVPYISPKVSDHMDEIVALIASLVERGHAYAVEGQHSADAQDVYFAVDSFPEYGKLSGKKLDDLRAGERVDVDGRKRHPGDFALWKSARPGEPTWDSPWGPGRPGWHIECSAMSMHYLGQSFDIHGGGIDLVFPHHENEIAQSECGTGHAPFAKYWLHNGHLTLETEKMSKSLGNIVRIRDILDEVPAEALRLLYLESHYRSPLPFSTQRLADSLGAVDRLYTCKEVLEQMAEAPANESIEELGKNIGDAATEVINLAQGFAANFAGAMDDDFNSAKSIGLLFELVRAVNRFGNNKKWRKRGAALAAPCLEAFAVAGRVLGLGGLAADDWFEQVRTRRLAAIGKDESWVQTRIDARISARDGKDWGRADEIRDELLEVGVVLMDGVNGTTWRMSV